MNLLLPTLQIPTPTEHQSPQKDASSTPSSPRQTKEMKKSANTFGDNLKQE